MKIVIGGAGAVGSHLAKLLSRENHEISIIDDDAQRLRSLSNSYDISTVQGSPTNISTLKSAIGRKCDMFVAVTKYESRNLNAAIFASKLGARQTVARIDNAEYLGGEAKAMFEELGVNRLVYPEKLAADEIVTNIHTSWVRQRIDFFGGKLVVLGIKVRDGAPIVGLKLMELKNSEHYRLVAIRRNEETIMPTGHTVVMSSDVVYFITTPAFIDQVREDAGKSDAPIRDLMIAGGSKIAVRTAQLLSADGLNIKMIERDPVKIHSIIDQLDHVLVMQGDATNIELLKDEDIEDLDAFLSLTDNSEANILACMAARRFGVNKIVAEVENVDYIPLAERMDIGMVINKMEIAASHIYKYTLGEDVSEVKRLTYADAEIVEMTVKKGSRVTKGLVKDLHLPSGMFIGGLVREGEGRIVNGMTEIQPGDQAIVFCPRSSIQMIRMLFG